MSACEKCWSAASRAAAMFGGVAADHYADILRETEAAGIDHNPEPSPLASLLSDDTRGPR